MQKYHLKTRLGEHLYSYIQGTPPQTVLFKILLAFQYFHSTLFYRRLGDFKNYDNIFWNNFNKCTFCYIKTFRSRAYILRKGSLKVTFFLSVCPSVREFCDIQFFVKLNYEAQVDRKWTGSGMWGTPIWGCSLLGLESKNFVLIPNSVFWTAGGCCSMQKSWGSWQKTSLGCEKNVCFTFTTFG